HSNSPEQAGLLGIDGVIASDDLIAKLITYWDVQVLQGGQVVDYDTRFNEIVARYGDNHIVSQAHFLARPRIKKILAEVDELLDKTTLEMNSLAVD
ncbi:MAG: hypothetical protein KDD53_00510, partial [Bdellovibrionales bacterium]|nr:hypothetical protein [Bdellovibrionales bacterium]